MPRIGQLLDLLRRARRLEDIPDVGDEAAFRQWVAEAAALADDLGDHTDSDADDRGGQTLRAVTVAPFAWSPFYTQLLRFLRPEMALPNVLDLALAAKEANASLSDVLAVWMILAGALRMENTT